MNSTSIGMVTIGIHIAAAIGLLPVKIARCIQFYHPVIVATMVSGNIAIGRI